MQIRIDIALVGPDAPDGGGSHVYGTPTSLSRISILNGFARDFAIRETHGAFSLKWIPKGVARYGVDRAQHLLSGDKVLFLHARQPYEVEFRNRGGNESLCVFFSQRIFEEAARRNLHLALARLPGAFFGRGEAEVLSLRSVLMKPEHEQWVDRIWEILDEATNA